VLKTPFFDRNKAVADGAISFYLDHFVAARVSKFAYGVEVSRRYQPWNAEHVRRNGQTYMGVTGHRMIEGIFDTVLPKVGFFFPSIPYL